MVIDAIDQVVEGPPLGLHQIADDCNAAVALRDEAFAVGGWQIIGTAEIIAALWLSHSNFSLASWSGTEDHSPRRKEQMGSAEKVPTGHGRQHHRHQPDGGEGERQQSAWTDHLDPLSTDQH